MPIRALLAWDANDLPSTWNDRYRDIFKVGVYYGGTVSPTLPLQATISPFVAVSFDGMVVRDDSEAHTVPLTDNADQLICLLAKYREFDPPVLQWQVILTSTLPTQPDQDYLIIFARAITVGGVITSLTPWAEQRQDGVGRHPLRPPVATVADLPTTGNVVGDVTPVLADYSEFIWGADEIWHPHYANIDPFVLTITSGLSSLNASLRYGNGTGIIAGGASYEERPGPLPGNDSSLSDYRTEVRAEVQVPLPQTTVLAVEGFSALLNGHFLKTRPVKAPLVPIPGQGAWPMYAVFLEYYREQLTSDPTLTTPYYKRFTTRALTAPGDPVDTSTETLLPLVESLDQNMELNFDYFPIEVMGGGKWVRAQWQLTVKPINPALADVPHEVPAHLHNYLKVDPLAVWGGATTYALETGGPGPNPYWAENLYVGPKADAYDGVAYMIPLFVVRTDGTSPLPTTRAPWATDPASGNTGMALWPLYPRVRDNLQQLATDRALLDHIEQLAAQRALRCSGFVDFGGYRWLGSPNNIVMWERENLQPPAEFGPNAKHIAVQIDGFTARLPQLAQLVALAQLPAPPSGVQIAARRDFIYLVMRRVLNDVPNPQQLSGWLVDTGVPVPYYEYVNDVAGTPAKRLALGTLKYQLQILVAPVGDAFDEFSAFYQYSGEAPVIGMDGRPQSRPLNGLNYHRHASDPGLWVSVEDLRQYYDQRPVLQSVWPAETEPVTSEPPLANDTLARDARLITDGLVYAIPLALVHRRNTATFDPCTNPNGTLSQQGQPLSYRPDGAVDATRLLDREILDLRHLVELCATDLESVLYRSLDLTTQGKLFTSFGFDQVGGVLVRDRLGAEILRTEQLGGDPCSDELAPPDGKRLLWSDSEEYYSRPLHQQLDAVQLGQGFDLSIQPPGWWGADPTYSSQLCLQPYTLEGRNLTGQVGTPANGAGTPVVNGGALRLVRGSVMYMLEDGLSIPPAYVMAYPNIAARRVAVFDTMDWESVAATPNLDGCELRHGSTAAYERLEEVAWGVHVSANAGLRTWLGYVGANPQDLTNYHSTEFFTSIYERYHGRVNHGLKFTPTRSLLGFRHEEITQPQPATVDDYVFPDIPHLRLRVKPTKVIEYAFYQWNGANWVMVTVPDATTKPVGPAVGQTVHVTTPGPDEGYWVWNGAAWDLIAVVTTLPVAGTYVGVVVHYMEPLGNILWKFSIPFSDLYRATAEQLYGDPTANIAHLGALLSSCVYPIEVNDGETPVAMYGYEVHGIDSVDIYVKSLPESTNIDYSGYGADPQANPWPQFNLGRVMLPMPAVDSSKYYNVMVAVRFDYLFTGYRLGKANRSVEALYEWRTQYLYNGEESRFPLTHTSTLDSIYNTAVVARDGVILAAHVYRVPTTSEKLAGKTKNLWVTNHRLAPQGYLGTNFVPLCLLFDQDGYINPTGAPDHNVYMVHYLVHRPVKTCERVLVNYLFAPYQGIVRDNVDAMQKLQGKALRVSDVFTTGYGAYAPWLNYWLLDPLWPQSTPNQGVRSLEASFERAWHPTLRHDLYYNYANLLGYLPFPKLDSIGVIVKNENCGQLEGWNIDEGDIKPPVFQSQILPPGLVRRHRRPDLFFSMYGFTDPLLVELAAAMPFGGESTMFTTYFGMLGPNRAVPWFAYFRNSQTSTLNLGYNQLHQLDGYGYSSTDPLQAFHSLLRLSGAQQAVFANENIVPGRRGWLFTETYASHDLIMQLPQIHPQICQVRYPSGNVFFGPDGDYWNRVAAPDATGAEQFPGQFGVAWAGQDMDYPLIGVGITQDISTSQLEYSLTQNPPAVPTPVSLGGRSTTPPSLVRASLYNYLGMMLQHPSGDLLLQITCGYSCNPVFSPVGGIYDGFVPLYRPLVRENQLDQHKSTYRFQPYLLPPPADLAPLANTGTYCLTTPAGPGPGQDVPFTVCIDSFVVMGQGSQLTGHWGGLPTVPPQIMVGIWTSEAERLAHPYNPDRIIEQGCNNLAGAGLLPLASTFAYDASALRGVYHVQVTAMPGNSVSVTITKPDSTTVNLGPIAFNPGNPGDPVAFVIDAHLTITTTVLTVVSWNATTNFNYLLRTLGVGSVADPGLACLIDPAGPGTWSVIFGMMTYLGVPTDRVAVWLVDGAHAADNYMPTDRLCDPAVATIDDIN